MNNFRYKFARWMEGRYGMDQLYYALLVLYLILLFLNMIFRKLLIFGILSWVVLILAFYRFFSRNIERRRKENQVFLSVFGKLTGRLGEKWSDLSDSVDWKTGRIIRTDRSGNMPQTKAEKGPGLMTKLKDFPRKKYTSCPQCAAVIRVPRQRGKHTVRCPRCGHRFGVKILIGKKTA
ncbi:MAG: hypothetical protein IIU00_06840 [Clostridia bacterium]|nr:hypothetical protein [Clostridia bacterium]